MRKPIRSVVERLVSAGRAPVSAPRAAFAEALEDRLRAVSALSLEPVRPPVGRPAPGSRTHGSRPRRSFAGLGLVGSAVAVAILLAGGSTAPLRVRVASATNALVVLPDGTVDEAAPGLVVPDGSRLLTGDEGRLVAGKVELGPNREALVDRGTVRPSARLPVSTIHQPTATPPSPARVSPDPAHPVPEIRGEPQPIDRGDPEPVEPSPEVRPGPSPDQGKPTGGKPHSPASPGPDPTQAKPEGGTGETTTSTSRDKQAGAEPEWLRLAANRRDGAVRLSWSIYEGRGFAAYLVLRTEGGSEPRYPLPLDRSTTVVARLGDQHASGYLDTVPGSGRYLYRVVAVDAERRLLARTPVVAPEKEGGASPTVEG